jgi:nicotinamidase-related amidase
MDSIANTPHLPTNQPFASMNITKTNTSALVVIDLQRDLCLDQRRTEVVKPAVVVINRLVEYWVEKSRPIFYTRFELPPDDPQFERFGDRYCVQGTEGAEFIDDILPLRGPVIAKRKHSAFFATDLEEQIRAADCDGVVLTGLQTQICILTTAADAYNRGLSVIVAEDGVVSTREDVRLEALDWIRKYVGDVASSDELMAV